ncbi:MAG: TusE/DsrC/DsvC family sulfur relay protein [Nitrospinae bacterium]|nr:TusE/DsrC/DsvC family sulfur relay protein [Nitrospinota bacterium]
MGTAESSETGTGKGYAKVQLPSWDKASADRVAREEGLELTEYHWEILTFIREYYQKHQVPLKVKDLMREVGKTLGAQKGSARYLYRLFPNGPSIQGAKIAGVPVPQDDIDW